MPPKRWETLSSRLVYQNPWTKVREDVALMPNGKTTLYGVIECGQCVGVLPFIDDNHVVMVRQYRYVFGEDHRWEMPTGGVKLGEAPEAAARREAREEIGYEVRDLQLVSTYFPSKSIVQEVGYLYVGRGLTQVKAVPDETEFLEIEIFPFDRVVQMVIDSEIRDSMTVVTVLHAARLRGL